MNLEIVFTFSYKAEKGWRDGIWYFELYASCQGQTQQIRAGNIPYPTKRKAVAAALERIQRLEDEEERKRKQNAILSRTEEN